MARPPPLVLAFLVLLNSLGVSSAETDGYDSYEGDYDYGSYDGSYEGYYYPDYYGSYEGDYDYYPDYNYGGYYDYGGYYGYYGYYGGYDDYGGYYGYYGGYYDAYGYSYGYYGYYGYYYGGYYYGYYGYYYGYYGGYEYDYAGYDYGGYDYGSVEGPVMADTGFEFSEAELRSSGAVISVEDLSGSQDAMAACLTATGANEAEYTDEQIAGCRDEAMQVFIDATGGDASYSSLQLMIEKAAVDNLATETKDCVANAAGDEAALAACDGQARNAFVESGGDPSAFLEAKQDATISAVGDSVSNCMASSLNGNDNPTEEEFNNARYSCSAEASREILEMGGDSSEASFVLQQASQNALADAYSSCTLTPDECRDAAKQAFVNALGTEEAFETARKAAAQNSAGDTLSTCIEKLLSDRGDTTGLPTDDERAECDSEAILAFQLAGGLPAEFAKARVQAAQNNMVNSLSVCKKDQLATGATEEEASATCQDVAMAKFTTSGGNPAKFWAAIKETAAQQSLAAYFGCLSLESMRSGGADPTETIKADCQTTASGKFVELDGKAEDFLQTMQEFIVNKVMSDMLVCIGTDTTAGVYTELTLCKNKGFTEYLASFGTLLKWPSAFMTGVQRVLADSMEACLTDPTSDLTEEELKEDCKAYNEGEATAWSINPASLERALAEGAQQVLTSSLSSCLGRAGDDESKKEQCDLDIKAAYVDAGGSEERYASDKRAAAASQSANKLVSCMDEEGATEDSCEEVAIAAMAASNGNIADFWVDSKSSRMTKVLKNYAYCADQGTVGEAELDSVAENIKTGTSGADAINAIANVGLASCLRQATTLATDVLKMDDTEFNLIDLIREIQSRSDIAVPQSSTVVDARFKNAADVDLKLATDAMRDAMADTISMVRCKFGATKTNNVFCRVTCATVMGSETAQADLRLGANSLLVTAFYGAAAEATEETVQRRLLQTDSADASVVMVMGGDPTSLSDTVITEAPTIDPGSQAPTAAPTPLPEGETYSPTPPPTPEPEDEEFEDFSAAPSLRFSHSSVVTAVVAVLVALLA